VAVVAAGWAITLLAGMTVVLAGRVDAIVAAAGGHSDV
jgi:hypothetical protein